MCEAVPRRGSERTTVCSFAANFSLATWPMARQSSLIFRAARVKRLKRLCNVYKALHTAQYTSNCAKKHYFGSLVISNASNFISGYLSLVISVTLFPSLVPQTNSQLAKQYARGLPQSKGTQIFLKKQSHTHLKPDANRN